MARRKEKSPSGFVGLGAWSEPARARPQLDRRQIVERALKVLDEVGFDGLTMRRLAESLGIQAASLYNHVKDKQELLAMMADRICEEIPDLDPRKPWREQAEAMGRNVRRVLRAHRDGARVLAATPPIGPQRLRLMEQGLRAGEGSGLSPADVADASFVFNSYVTGFVLDETMGEPPDPALAKRMRDEGRKWFKSLPREQFPALVAHADALLDSSADRRFELGMRALLDGLELRRKRR